MRLRLFLAVAAAALAASVAMLVAAVAAVDGGLRTVGHEAGPRVAAANELYGALAGMDAELANVLLVGDKPGLGFDRQAALNTYAADRDAVARALQQAAEGAHGANARQAVDELVAGFAVYDNLAGQAMLTDRQADNRGLADISPALPLQREATDLMHQQLLPAADRLIGEDAATVEAKFAAAHGDGRTDAYAAFGLGAAALAALVGAQAFLFRRTHRVLNPGLLAATVVTAVLLLQAVGAVFSAAEQLRVAKRDAFDSVLAMTRTKAVAADANGDESRYLVDPERAVRYQDAFLAKSQQLATIDGTGLHTYDDALAAAENRFADYAAGDEPPFHGDLFGREFRNITFTGERAAAEEAFRWYRTYQLYDRRMRTYLDQDRRQAIDFTTSYRDGNSNWAYDRLQKALTAVVVVNRTHMDQATRSGERSLDGQGHLPAVGAAAAMAIAYAGLRPRLREYRTGG